MKYIAYGSNMVEEQMAVRCPDARLIGTGYISGARLEFYLHATVEETGDQRNRVPVAVWEINQRDEQMLDRYEGYPSYYIKEPHTQYYDGIANAYRRLGLGSQIKTVLKPALERSIARGYDW